MERLLIECFVRATLIVAATAIVLWAARIRTPALLHSAWASVVAAMLLLPVWTLWGPSASIPVLPQREVAVGPSSRPLVAIGAASAPQAEGIRSRLEPQGPARDSVWG